MHSISILTIGDEICIGQVVNTNAAWIAAECTRRGCHVAIHSTIGDVITDITAELARLLADTDTVILTGGLGPTHDDVTKAALCNFFDDTLTLHEPTLGYLTELFARRGIAVSERNRTQAMLPSKCQILRNPRGTAPGMKFETDGGKTVISLPGVPAEMKGIMLESVLPLLEKMAGSEEQLRFRTLQTTGITEANLADAIGNPDEFLEGGTLAFLPSYQGVRLRIGVKAPNAEEATQRIARIEDIIRTRAGNFIFGVDDDSLASVAAELLMARGETVSVAESCTGGLLGAALTDIPGSSAFFPGGVLVYSYESKVAQLGVKQETLAQFGAVSGETVCEMATAVREKFSATYGIAISGIAGPDGGMPDKPVGTVWIALAHPNGVIPRKFIFGNDRRINRERSVGAALAMLVEILRSEATRK